MKIIISGMPGVGKSTILEKVCSRLKARNTQLLGCIVKEMRNNEKRCGFKIQYLLDLHESLLASSEQHLSSHYLSKYSLHIESVENELIPFMQEMIESTTVDVLIFDEIGRIQNFSPMFLPAVNGLIAAKKPLLATIVYADEPWARSYKSTPNIFLIEVTEANREFMSELITIMLESINDFNQLTPSQEYGVRQFFTTFMKENKFLELRKLFKHTVSYLSQGKATYDSQIKDYIVQGKSALRNVIWEEPYGYRCTCSFQQGQEKDIDGNLVPRVCSHIQTVSTLENYNAPTISNQKLIS